MAALAIVIGGDDDEGGLEDFHRHRFPPRCSSLYYCF